MAISDVYVVSSGLQSVAATSQTPLLLVKGSANNRLWIVGIRVDIGVTAAAAGNSVLFQLYRTSNTPVSSGSALTVTAHDAAGAPFTGAAYSAWATAPSVTAGSQLWEQELPQTTGSSWEEFPPLGYEWSIPLNSGATGWIVMMVTNSVGTSTPVSCDLIISQ
jgi:hypothetical protein